MVSDHYILKVLVIGKSQCIMTLGSKDAPDVAEGWKIPGRYPETFLGDLVQEFWKFSKLQTFLWELIGIYGNCFFF